MRTLLLLRHAKSSRDEPDLADHDRPLAPRGSEAAPRIGAWLREHDPAPDLILCSTAVRAQQTLRLLRPALGDAAPVRLLKSLYLASPSRLLSLIRRLPEDARCVLLIGHNPGLASVAQELAGDGSGKALKRMDKKFPTAAVAELTLAEGSWPEVAPGAMRLAAFVRPKDLA